MPTLGAALDFAKYEGRNFRSHNLGTAPSAPVAGQMYYNTADNTLYWWNTSTWIPSTGLSQATADTRYLRLTGGNLTGPLTISNNTVGVSPDAGNTITWRANGFYAAAGAIQISADPDNILENKGDGLFVRKGLVFGK